MTISCICCSGVHIQCHVIHISLSHRYLNTYVCVFQVCRLVTPINTSPVKMVALSLKICVRQCNVVKTMQFEPCTPVYDACRIIRERVPEAQTGQGERLGKATVNG